MPFVAQQHLLVLHLGDSNRTGQDAEIGLEGSARTAHSYWETIAKVLYLWKDLLTCQNLSSYKA